MWAFIFSILLGNLVKIPESLRPGVDFAAGGLLRGAVAAYGLIVSPLVWLKAGYALPVALAVVFAVFFLGLRIGQRLGLSRELSTLIAVGSCICGASAIAATAPAIRAKDEEAGMALATITLFGLMAMVVYPFLYTSVLQGVIGSQVSYGVWVGAGVHETAQVIAAASQIGQEAANVALTVKSVRIFMIGPMVILAVTLFYKSQMGSGTRLRRFIPSYALVFVASSLLSGLLDASGAQPNSLNIVKEWATIKTVLSRYMLPFVLGAAFAGVGLKIRVVNMKRIGVKPFLIGSAVAVIASLLALALTFIISPFL